MLFQEDNFINKIEDLIEDGDNVNSEDIVEELIITEI